MGVIYGSSGKRVPADEKGQHLSAVNSPSVGDFEFLALKGLHRVAQAQPPVPPWGEQGNKLVVIP